MNKPTYMINWNTKMNTQKQTNKQTHTNRNALLAEYKEHPGHVFIESIKDIQQGEEIFVSYGASYWNLTQYPEE